MSADLTAKWQEVCEFIPSLMKRIGIPGVAVGVLVHGEEFAAGFGVTNLDHPLPVTDPTLFQIGSNTKTFTGTAIMRFVDQGKLALSDKVRKFFPDFQVADEEVSANVTVRHLLNHMSGWDGDVFVDTGEGADAIARYVDHIKGREQMAPMDTVWTYNNSGFSMLGRILELVSDKPYEAVMKEMVFGPLGLENTYLDPWDVMTYRYAVGHTVTPEGAKVARPWRLGRGIGPAGRIVSNVRDMLKYAKFHMGDGRAPNGERILSTELLYRMRSPDAVVFDQEKWGLAWAVDDSAGPRRVWHGGGTVGQISNLSFFPEHQFAFCLLTNADAGRIFNPKAIAFLIKQYLRIDVPELKPVQATPEELAEAVGKYTRPANDIEVGMVGGQLAAVMTPKQAFPSRDVPTPPPTPPMPVTKCGKDRLLIPVGIAAAGPIDIIRKPDGSVGWLRVGYRIHKKVE